MSDKILSREERIANAARFAPQNATQEREGLAIGELVTVNVDMLRLLHEDVEALRADRGRWKARAEAQPDAVVDRLAREVARLYILSDETPDINPEFDQIDRQMWNAMDALAAHFAEQDKGKTE